MIWIKDFQMLQMREISRSSLVSLIPAQLITLPLGLPHPSPNPPHPQVYRPGSTSAAATLWDARDLFDAGSARADRLLRDVQAQLPEAVTACVEAAGAAF